MSSNKVDTGFSPNDQINSSRKRAFSKAFYFPLEDKMNLKMESSEASTSNVSDCELDVSFELDFGLKVHEKPTKKVEPSYSKKLNKLFVSREKAMSIAFNMSRRPPEFSWIKVTPFYSATEYESEVIRRCPYHIGDSFIGQHIITVHSAPNSNVLYEESCDGRLSVKVACDNCIISKPFVIVYKFQCLSSCRKSIKRRDFYLHFELVYENLILHSVSLPTLISTCPGRDRIKYESLYDFGGLPKEEQDDYKILVHVSDAEGLEMLNTFVKGLMLNGG